jgi:hypothetical protein
MLEGSQTPCGGTGFAETHLRKREKESWRGLEIYVLDDTLVCGHRRGEPRGLILRQKLPKGVFSLSLVNFVNDLFVD